MTKILVSVMNKKPQLPANPLRSWVFGLCILAAGFLLMATVKNIFKTQSAVNWQVHTGTLTSGDLSGRRSGLYSTNWLKYTYEVDGKKYEGTRIGYGISSTKDVQVVDGRLRVFINPSDSSDAVLVTGFRKSHFFGLVFSGAFIWLAFYLWRRLE